MLDSTETVEVEPESQPKTKRGLPKHLVGINERRRAAGLPVGRPKGVPNKLTTLVRTELLGVYDAIGGRDAFVRWAQKHPTQFYGLLVKSAPREREANSLGSGVQIIINDGAAEVRPVTIDHDQPSE